MLQQILCASRFAQYIKVMIRDKVGGYFGAQDCERYLQRWLEQYTTGRDDLPWEMMARYPLREARVRVLEEPGKPGDPGETGKARKPEEPGEPKKKFNGPKR